MNTRCTRVPRPPRWLPKGCRAFSFAWSRMRSGSRPDAGSLFHAELDPGGSEAVRVRVPLDSPFGLYEDRAGHPTRTAHCRRTRALDVNSAFAAFPEHFPPLLSPAHKWRDDSIGGSQGKATAAIFAR